MNSTTNIHAHIAFVPTAADVASIAVGDLALDCFGHWCEVTEICARRTDIDGVPFVVFCLQSGPTSTMSASYKAGRLVRTVALSADASSAQLDAVERDMRKHGERTRSHAYVL